MWVITAALLWKAALSSAFKTGVAYAFVLAVTVPAFALGFGELLSTLGVYGVSFCAAAIGSVCRWLYFKLPHREGLYGLIGSSLGALFFAQFHPPILDSLIGTVSPEDKAMMIGFVIGMFPTFIVGWFQDFKLFKGQGK